jgi:hypothetical protein
MAARKHEEGFKTTNAKKKSAKKKGKKVAEDLDVHSQLLKLFHVRTFAW